VINTRKATHVALVNRSTCAPKNDCKVYGRARWPVASVIDVASEQKGTLALFCLRICIDEPSFQHCPYAYNGAIIQTMIGDRHEASLP
jgi:hypothetical protein